MWLCRGFPQCTDVNKVRGNASVSHRNVSRNVIPRQHILAHTPPTSLGQSNSWTHVEDSTKRRMLLSVRPPISFRSFRFFETRHRRTPELVLQKSNASFRITFRPPGAEDRGVSRLSLPSSLS